MPSFPPVSRFSTWALVRCRRSVEPGAAHLTAGLANVGQPGVDPGESEWLKPRIRVADQVAEFVTIDLLGNAIGTGQPVLERQKAT